MSRNGRDPNVLAELAHRVRAVAHAEVRNNGTHVERWRVRQPSPLLLEEIEGDLVLEEGDPDFTIGDTLRQHIASYGLKADDQVLVVHSGAEWHAFDAAGVASPAAVVTTAQMNAAIAAAITAAKPPLVSALPGSPVDGQLIDFQNEAMAAAGVVWRFRYRAASPSAYKWELVGGSDYWQQTDPGLVNTLPAENFAPIAVLSAPTFTTPFAGDWTITASAFGVYETANDVRVSGGTTALHGSQDAATLALAPGAGSNIASAVSVGRLNAVPSGSVLTVILQGGVSLKVVIYGPTLVVRPIRVG